MTWDRCSSHGGCLVHGSATGERTWNGAWCVFFSLARACPTPVRNLLRVSCLSVDHKERAFLCLLQFSFPHNISHAAISACGVSQISYIFILSFPFRGGFAYRSSTISPISWPLNPTELEHVFLFHFCIFTFLSILFVTCVCYSIPSPCLPDPIRFSELPIFTY
jgi:hypothetical protein